MFTSGMAMFLAGANVPFRDLQELIVVIFMVWFYATPIIYPFALVAGTDSAPSGGSPPIVLSYNPMTWFVRLFRESIYGEVGQPTRPSTRTCCRGAGVPRPLLSSGPVAGRRPSCWSATAARRRWSPSSSATSCSTASR